ncbi:MAG: RelA/SpoT family protein [Bacilli bacterium]|nr:RelA/SpoT family protein [Bacteroidales bacterium]MDD4187896.1 RelA/SpoT family protein [Bacilli bacterium]
MKFETLLKNIIKYNSDLNDLKMIKSAYSLAESLHKDQTRQSGEPYIIHPLFVASILAEMRADKDTICAGLLHDTIEDSNITKEEIAEQFNEDVSNLVDGVTKISKLNFSSKDEQRLANTRKIITSITDDVRIIIIKLADRLHNMQTLSFKSEFKQKENALETMEIFVPLAYYIGAYQIKSELEDLSLRYLKPDMYKSIEEKQMKVQIDSENSLSEMLQKIQRLLNDKNIPNELKVRTKNIYGIYKRISEGFKLADIHDLLALKIILEDVENCYKVLGIVHQQYHPINDKFKDYICNPKTNMYKSLHTTVFAPDDRLVQTQIRTDEMDQIAAYGLTAHWDINKGQARNLMQKDLTEKYQFFKSLVEINTMFGDNQEFVAQVKKELLTGKVYIYTTRGDIIELPAGATVIDFAYKIHTDIGNTMVGATVNEEHVAIDYILRNKDRVRIITDDLSFGPRVDWLDKAQTSYAKKKIKEFNRR